jgi:hypothetical protein
MKVNETILKVLETLPEEGTLDEAIERLVLLYNINKGLIDVRVGNTFSLGEARKRFEQWLRLSGPGKISPILMP